MSDHLVPNPHMRELLDLVSGTVALPCKVLDAGCGNAKVSLWFADRGCNVLAVDMALRIPLGQCVRVEDVDPGFLELRRADLLAFDPGTEFDIVALLGVLHCCSGDHDVQRLLANLPVWTASDGVVAVSWITDELEPRLLTGYYPSEQFVFQEMASIGFTPIRIWKQIAHHDHGGVHRHMVIYSCWRRH